MWPRFSRLEKLIGKESLENLNKKSVLILGCGGVGGFVVEALARSNIGTLILVDYDIVDVSNINRQIIATDKTIGKKKTALLKMRIQQINPLCNVVLIDKFIDAVDVLKLFKLKIDFLVDACDTITTKKEIIKQCLLNKIPFITCLGTGNRFDPSKLKITTLDNTSYDPIARILRKFVRDEKITNKITVLASTEKPLKLSDRTPGSTVFVPASAGLLIASYVVNFFLKKEVH